MPPANTAQASTITGGSKYFAKPSAATMNATLSSVGVNAGIAKRLQVLRMPPASDTSEMNRMYGNVTRSIAVVSWNFSPSAAKPGALT